MTQRWLAFDSSTEQLSIGVGVGDRVLQRTLAGGAQASTSLIAQALDMLAEAGLTLAQLDAIVFGRGPGSFTGLRTACAVAQGLAFGADVPVLPVDTLLAVAQEARMLTGMHSAPLTVLALLDARMDEVYSAACDWDGRSWQMKTPLQVSAPEQIVRPAADTLILAGNAFDAYGQRLHHLRQGTGAPVTTLTALPTAAALLQLAPNLMAQGLAVPADQAMPLYIRDRVAQTTAEREAAKASAATQPAAHHA